MVYEVDHSEYRPARRRPSYRWLSHRHSCTTTSRKSFQDVVYDDGEAMRLIASCVALIVRICWGSLGACMTTCSETMAGSRNLGQIQDGPHVARLPLPELRVKIWICYNTRITDMLLVQRLGI